MKKIILSVFIVLSVLTINAQQDIHQGFWYTALSNLNPAAAGMGKETMRFNSNFRSQYFTATQTAYRTVMASADGRFTPNALTDGHLGFGVNFYNDVQGANKLTTNFVKIPINYGIEINRYTRLSVGASIGYIQQTISGSTWGNQWNGTTFDQGIDSREAFTTSKIGKFDAGAGFYYVSEPSDYRRYFFGASGEHLTQQTINLGASKTNLFRKFNFHGGAELSKRNSRIAFIPQGMMTLAGPNMLLIAGTDMKIYIREPSKRTTFVEEISFTIGAYARWRDGFVVNGSYTYKGFSIGAGYDVNISRLRIATKTVGGFELFLRYVITLEDDEWKD